MRPASRLNGKVVGDGSMSMFIMCGRRAEELVPNPYTLSPAILHFSFWRGFSSRRSCGTVLHGEGEGVGGRGIFPESVSEFFLSGEV